jgi:hypothetical protein
MVMTARITQINVLLILMFTLSCSTYGQTPKVDGDDDPDVVTCQKGNHRPNRFSVDRGFGISSTSEAQAIVRAILKLDGRSESLIRVQPTRDISTAAACLATSGIPFRIFFNPGFFQVRNANDYEYWRDRAILAHEVGHIVRNHFTSSDSGSIPSIELDADQFAGRTLARMRASREQALGSFNDPVFDCGSDCATHPPLRDRLQKVAQGWDAEKDEERERSKIGEWKGNSTSLQHDVGRAVGEEWFMSTLDVQGFMSTNVLHSRVSIELAPGHYRLESILNCNVEDERGTIEQIDEDATHRYFIEKGKGKIQISIGHPFGRTWSNLGSAALTSVLQDLGDNQFTRNNKPCNGKYQTLSFDFTVKKLEKYELRVQSLANMIFEVDRPEEPSKLFKYHKYGRVSASLRRISLFRLQ